MVQTISGREVLNILSAFREPVNLAAIVEKVAEKHAQTSEQVEPLVLAALEGCIRYGFIEKHQDFYYDLNDAMDALENDFPKDDDTVLEDVESVASIESGGEHKAKSNTKVENQSYPIPFATQSKQSTGAKEQSEVKKEEAKDEDAYVDEECDDDGGYSDDDRRKSPCDCAACRREKARRRSRSRSRGMRRSSRRRRR